jgi:hypothetical protein
VNEFLSWDVVVEKYMLKPTTIELLLWNGGKLENRMGSNFETSKYCV